MLTFMVYALATAAESLDKLGDHDGAVRTLHEASKLAANSRQWVSHQENRTSHGPSTAYLLFVVGRTQAGLGDREGALASLRLAMQSPDE